MAQLPYKNFPFQFYKKPYRSPYSYPYFSSISQSANKSPHHNSENQLNIEKEKNKSNKNNDAFLFDLFGLKIYYDDILLISLIYFLYSEGVKDDGLFIVLVLLLLS